MRRRLDQSNCWVVAVLTMMGCLLPLRAYGSSAILLDAERQFEFAEEYFEQGQYYRAIGEYERFIHFFPDDEKVELAGYRIGLCYLKGEQYQDAMRAFQCVIDSYPSSPYATRSYFGISEASVGLKRYDEALFTLQNVMDMSPDQDVKDEAYDRCGWVYLHKGLWEEAGECFNQISSGNRDKYNAEPLIRELEKKEALRHKNPTAAGLLAILPGAGHLYCERYREALISFLLNGALIFAAYEAFDHDQNIVGGVIGVVEAGFYSGNIYSAVSSAHKFNRDEKNRFLQYLREVAQVNLSLEKPRSGGTFLISCKVLF